MIITPSTIRLLWPKLHKEMIFFMSELHYKRSVLDGMKHPSIAKTDLKRLNYFIKKFDWLEHERMIHAEYLTSVWCKYKFERKYDSEIIIKDPVKSKRYLLFYLHKKYSKFFTEVEKFITEEAVFFPDQIKIS